MLKRKRETNRIVLQNINRTNRLQNKRRRASLSKKQKSVSKSNEKNSEKNVKESNVRKKEYFFTKYLTNEKKYDHKSIAITLKKHPEITILYRAKLFEWIIQIGETLNMKRKTVFLAMQVFDELLHNTSNIELKKVQLIGLTVIFCCSKLNEVSYRRAEAYIALLDGFHSISELYECEDFIFQNVNFSALNKPTVFDFGVYFFDEIFPSLKIDKENIILSNEAKFSDFPMKYSVSPMYGELLSYLTSLLQCFTLCNFEQYLSKSEIALFAVWKVMNSIPSNFQTTLKKIRNKIKRSKLKPSLDFIINSILKTKMKKLKMKNIILGRDISEEFCLFETYNQVIMETFLNLYYKNV